MGWRAFALAAAIAVALSGFAPSVPLAAAAPARHPGSQEPASTATGQIVTSAAPGGDWTQFHNGPTHEGHNTAETAISASNVANLRLAWTGATGSRIHVSSPVVADDVVYVGSEDRKLYAYAVGCSNGGAACTPLWTATTGSGISSSPAVADGVVYVGSEDGKLYAFAAGCNSGGGSCTPLWTGATGAGIEYSSPAVADGVVYVGSNDGKLYAFAAGCNSGGRSCSPLWTGDPGGFIVSSPAVSDGVVYVGSDDGKLYAYAVDCASGGESCSPLWTGTTGGPVHTTPAVADGVVYVGSNDYKLYAYAVGCNTDGGSCTPLWTGATGAGIHSSPAVANGVVYVGSSDNKLYAYAVGCASGGGSCRPLWTGATGSLIVSSPAVANGVVYVGSGNEIGPSDNKLYAYAVGCNSGGGSCSPLWSGTTGGYVYSSPAVANGVVYIGSADDKLYAFGLVTVPGAPTAVLATAGNASASVSWSAPVSDGGSAITAYTVSVQPGGHTCGWTSGPLTCTVSGLTNGSTYSVTVHAHNSVGDGDESSPAVSVTLFGGATYHVLAPYRVMDSRIGRGGALFHSQVKQTVLVATTESGVPTDAVAVTGNVTVVSQTGAGYVTVAPSLASGVPPSTSTINFPKADTRANGVTIPLAAGGNLDFMYFTSSPADTVQVVFDVTGYFSE
jgi:outer membrane protein assembly factor BamB